MALARLGPSLGRAENWLKFTLRGKAIMTCQYRNEAERLLGDFEKTLPTKLPPPITPWVYGCKLGVARLRQKTIIVRGPTFVFVLQAAIRYHEIHTKFPRSAR